MKFIDVLANKNRILFLLLYTETLTNVSVSVSDESVAAVQSFVENGNY